MPPKEATELFNKFILYLENQNLKVAKGSFGADMFVKIENDGPVTFFLEY